MAKIQSNKDLEIQKELIQSGNIPKHIAIIMDGNGRWAKSKGLPRFTGHKIGVESVKDIVKACSQLGVQYLTLYTFSTENWNRPQKEISTLMRLIVQTLRKEIDELLENNIKLTAIGDIDSLPDNVKNELLAAIEKTKNNKKMILNLALSYSGRWEIIEAVKKICNEVCNEQLSIDEICTDKFSQYLTTKNFPDPDLLIRTSGEFRVSNFLLWQIAYTEFYISKEYWPAFRRKNLYEAIKDYQKRERRFGKLSEQLKVVG
ncbi:MAG: isoprenyl transferase [Ignavibacterium sp.]